MRSVMFRTLLFSLLMAVLLVSVPACHRSKHGGGLGWGQTQSTLNAFSICTWDVYLQWTDAFEKEDGYQIERSMGRGEFAQIAVVQANVTTFTDTVPQAESPYEYRIRAFKKKKFSEYSQSLFVYSMLPPSNLEITTLYSSKIDLQWMDNSALEDGYSIERSADGVNYAIVGNTTGGNTTFVDMDVLPETIYFYRVRAIEDGGSMSDYSNEAQTEETPTTPWAKSYGGVNSDWSSSVSRTMDGYVVAGSSDSFGRASSVNMMLLKMDSQGSKDEPGWEKCYAGDQSDLCNDMAQALDGGYILAGYTESWGAGNTDFWVLKVNADGEITRDGWQKTYGESGYDEAKSVAVIGEGGYYVAGTTNSFALAGDADYWVLKLDADGNVIWGKSYGGVGNDFLSSMVATPDGGCVLAGTSSSFASAGGTTDWWILKLDAEGVVEYNKTYGGSAEDHVESIALTPDGGYIVAGYTNSFESTDHDIWVLKLDSSLETAGGWQKKFDISGNDYGRSACVTDDGGFIVTGEAIGSCIVLKLDSQGWIVWDKAYSGPNYEWGISASQGVSTGVVVSGSTTSFGDGSDFWVLKLEGDGGIVFDPLSGAQVSDTGVIVQDTSAVPDEPAFVICAASIGVSEDTNAEITDVECTVGTQAPGP